MFSNQGMAIHEPDMETIRIRIQGGEKRTVGGMIESRVNADWHQEGNIHSRARSPMTLYIDKRAREPV